MIVVAGFNTAIDRRVDVGALRCGTVHRALRVVERVGGKGVHVAQTIAALGESVRLVGLADAAHRLQLRTDLHRRNVVWREVLAAGALRQCAAIHEADGRVTEILEPGPGIDAATSGALIDATRAALQGASLLICTGSLPAGFAAENYADLLRGAAARGVKCFLDASGAALRTGIGVRPWLVKPNADEAGVFLGRPVRDVAAARDCARALQAAGVATPVVTLGDSGAVGFDGREFWLARAPRATTGTAVGSGDCFLAGLAVGMARGEPLDACLRLATACGAANAASDEAGYADPERVAAWLPRVSVTALATAP